MCGKFFDFRDAQSGILLAGIDKAKKDWKPLSTSDFIERLQIEKIPKKILKEDVVKIIMEVFCLSKEDAEGSILVAIKLGEVRKEEIEGKTFLMLVNFK